MRIISGYLKGKSINYVKNKDTRPLKDYVKENIFNIIKHSKLFIAQTEKSKVLDIYSGVGSFGIECISRGASEVTFVENNERAIEIFKSNLTNLSIIKKTIVIENKIEVFLKANIKNKKYDILFFDPPFKDKSFLKIISIIKKNEIYSSNNIVIIHREKNTEDSLEKLINIFLVKEYGRSKIIFGSLTN